MMTSVSRYQMGHGTACSDTVEHITIVMNRAAISKANEIVDQYQLSAVRTVDAVDTGHRYTMSHFLRPAGEQGQAS